MLIWMCLACDVWWNCDYTDGELYNDVMDARRMILAAWGAQDGM